MNEKQVSLGTRTTRYIPSGQELTKIRSSRDLIVRSPSSLHKNPSIGT